MPVNSRHPEYAHRAEDFQTARDTIEGEREVKHGLRLTTYLPVPPGLDEASGQITVNQNTGNRDIRSSRYAFYASFAEFPELPGPTIEAFQGLVHAKKPRIELPPEMEYLRERATPGGDTLQDLWEQHTRELFSVGRHVLLGEVESDDAVLLAPYAGDSLINWQESDRDHQTVPTMLVFAEGDYEFKDNDEFEQQVITRYRELRLNQTDEETSETGAEPGVRYQVRLWKSKGASAATAATANTDATVVPDDAGNEWRDVLRLGVSYDFIPVVVSNTHEMGLQYGRIPILPISKIALSIFRMTADYKRALYIKGDPQVVIYGIPKEDAPETVGGSEIWTFDDPNAKAEYLDLDGDGIPFMRDAIRDDFERYVAAAGRLLEHSARNGQESGQAVEKRLNAQHVTIASVVMKGGEAMQAALRMVGRMLGLDEATIERIVFKPDTRFVETTMTGQELLQLVSSKNMGAPLSRRSLHMLMQRGQLTEMEFDEEESEIESEPPPLTGLVPVEDEDAEDDTSDDEEDDNASDSTDEEDDDAQEG